MIKATDFVSEEAKKAAEAEALGALPDAFAKEMGGKIFEKLQAGYTGWDDATIETALKRKLLTNYENGDMVDVAACAMLIWNLHDQTPRT